MTTITATNGRTYYTPATPLEVERLIALTTLIPVQTPAGYPELLSPYAIVTVHT